MEIVQMLTKVDFGIRDFRSAEEQAKIGQRWRDEYPLKDGTEGCPLDLNSICFCTWRLLVYLKADEKPIGTVTLKETKEDAENEDQMFVILAIGDFEYMTKEVLRAMKECVCDYMRATRPTVKYALVFDGVSVEQVLNGLKCD